MTSPPLPRSTAPPGSVSQAPFVGCLIGSSPVQVLHQIPARERLAASDTNGVDLERRREIDRHPLRVERISLASEPARQVRIAFPVGVRIAVGQARIADGIGAIVRVTPRCGKG